ncbi:MAG: response regulator [Spirochaetaceae bacterium]|nr:MAG: response regulator [Spirochaetaceae bacterium]
MQIETAGYSVVHVTTGEDAIAIVAGQPGAFDLILMDIDLGPGIDGIEAAERIIASHDIPVVFLTSHTEREYIERADRISPYGYVVKDPDGMVLLRSITMAFRLFDAYDQLKQSSTGPRLT